MINAAFSNNAFGQLPKLMDQSADAKFAEAQSVRSKAMGAPTPARPSRKPGFRNTSEALKVVLAAIGSQALDKSGQLGAGLLSGYMQGEEAENASEFDQQMADYEKQQGERDTQVRQAMLEAEGLEFQGKRMDSRASEFRSSAQRRREFDATNERLKEQQRDQAEMRASGQFNTLIQRYGTARNSVEMRTAYGRMQQLATEFPSLQSALPPELSIEQDIEVRAQGDLVKLTSEVNQYLDRFGVIEDPQTKNYLETRRQAVANAWFGGDLNKVPPVPTQESLKAQMQAARIKQMEEDVRMRDATIKERVAARQATYAMHLQRLEVARGQLGVARDNVALRREELNAERAGKANRTEAETAIKKLQEDRAGAQAQLDNAKSKEQRLAASGRLSEIDGKIRWWREQQALTPPVAVRTNVPKAETGTKTSAKPLPEGFTAEMLVAEANEVLRRNPSARAQVVARLKQYGIEIK